MWRNTQRSGWCTSLFSIRSSSDLQREALYSAPSALSLFKALTLISLCALPTFRSTLNAYDYHYSRQRHLSRRNKFGFFISIITFPHAVGLLYNAHSSAAFCSAALCQKIYTFYLVGSVLSNKLD